MFQDQDIREPSVLLRKLQGIGLMEAIYAGTTRHYRGDMNFAKDSLFCEYAYFYNLDLNIIEFWEGFQRTPPDKFSLFTTFGQDKNDDGYSNQVGRIFNTYKNTARLD